MLSDAASVLNPFPPQEEEISVAQALAGDWNAVALDAWNALRSVTGDQPEQVRVLEWADQILREIMQIYREIAESGTDGLDSVDPESFEVTLEETIAALESVARLSGVDSTHLARLQATDRANRSQESAAKRRP